MKWPNSNALFSFHQSFTSGLNSPTKQPSFNHLEASFNHGSNDSWAADSSDENGLQDAYPKWMQVIYFHEVSEFPSSLYIYLRACYEKQSFLNSTVFACLRRLFLAKTCWTH